MRYLLFALLMLMAQSMLAQERTWLLYNVKIIQVTDGKMANGDAVLMEGSAIKAIGKYNTLRGNAPITQQVDGHGNYLIPGLWDMHIHLEGKELVEDNRALLPVFLAYGITSVRDCASDLGEQVLAWREEIKQGKLAGPNIFTAGRKLEGKNSIWKDDIEIENEVELNTALDKLDQYKVDFVKITENTLNGDLFLKSVRGAKARGYRVSGHVPIDVAIQELADAGYTSVEHASYLLRYGSDEQQIATDLRAGRITRAQADAGYASFDQAKAIEGYKRFAKTGMFVCPTLIGGRQLAYLDVTNHSQDPALTWLTEKFTANYQWRIQRMSGDTPEQKQQRKDRYQLLLKQLPLMQAAGIKFIAGSDAAALNTYVYPAESLIQELEIFEEAGLKPLKILQSATMAGPAYFNLSHKTGTIEANKTADLVLLEQNPLEHINALRSIRGVVSRGTYYDRKKLDDMIITAQEIKKQLDASRSPQKEK
ncbi:MAG: amidohydrolase family protein [Cyclobacteriaceae bacterium]|nr:amidohydrolase [Cytophagales bacterium]HNP78739.1 amidohydrolase family protein [Cyclobacteriaceae bacterium]